MAEVSDADVFVLSENTSLHHQNLKLHLGSPYIGHCPLLYLSALTADCIKLSAGAALA